MGHLITSKYGCSNIKILLYDNNSYCEDHSTIIIMILKNNNNTKAWKKNAVSVYCTTIEPHLFAIMILLNPGL